MQSPPRQFVKSFNCVQTRSESNSVPVPPPTLHALAATYFSEEDKFAELANLVEVQMVDLTAGDDSVVDLTADDDSNDDNDFAVTKVTLAQCSTNCTACATPQRPTKRVKIETPARDGDAAGRVTVRAVVFDSQETESEDCDSD